MTHTDYDSFFRAAMRDDSSKPYPYQRALAEGEWPEALNVPTGLGKTAAVTLAWLYRRRVLRDEGVPRRLVWCLPMRVLVEQVERNVREWLHGVDLLYSSDADDGVSVHVLMGGEPSARLGDWTRSPERDSILIGTQDMLLSRALMRGYGMSRHQWPVPYALLHLDSLWVLDEVQLMGPGLPTSAQLEAFRREEAARIQAVGGRPSRSLWMSATMKASWLDTVDLRQQSGGLPPVRTLSEDDLRIDAVERRRRAPKALRMAGTRLDAASPKKAVDAYIQALADEVAKAHVPGEQTLVIVNRVERAQKLYKALSDVDVAHVLLLHARFRPAERERIEGELRNDPPDDRGRIVVATQAVEAGVDLDSRTLFTELAPWSSFVQRAGRCNRAGDHEREREAIVYWVDMAEDVKGVPEPYAPDALSDAREKLRAASSASPADLPEVSGDRELAHVLRRRDLLELFNTDPDLSGFDVDVSPYIRDMGQPQVQVFWRLLGEEEIAEQPEPRKDELCPASIGQVRSHLSKTVPEGRRVTPDRTTPQAFRIDPLEGPSGRGQWTQVRADEIRPGQIVMLDAAEGGYASDRGFVEGELEPVEVLDVDAEGGSLGGIGADPETAVGRWVPLDHHLIRVAERAIELSEALGLSDEAREALELAARWHDVGKAHEAFQRGIKGNEKDGGPWAKSDGSGRPGYHVILEDGTRQPRRYFRHELASMLHWLESSANGLTSTVDPDLVAYLVAAHHGKVRLGLRALPGEVEPSGEAPALYARGVWEGDVLPPLRVDGQEIPGGRLRLDVMQMGRGPQGPSWAERTQGLLDEYGPFTIAWLEALLRIADWRASEEEEKDGGTD